MKKLLFVCSVLGMSLFAQSAYAGTIEGKVVRIWTNADNNFTIVEFSVSGSECGWATAMSFDAGTGGGKGLLSLATAALLSGRNVHADGKGTSYCPGSAESLKTLVLSSN